MRKKQEVYLRCENHKISCHPYAYSITAQFRIIINKITKEATYYADKISAKKDGIPNISNNIKRGKFRKNGEEYFIIDLKTERKKDSSFILDYYKL